MPDGTVRGAFTLSAEQPIRDLKTIRDTGAEADAALKRLGDQLDRIGRKRVTAHVGISGLDVANAKLSELEARLDRLDRRRAIATAGVGGGFGGGGLSVGSAASAGGGGAGAGRTLFGGLGGFGGIAGIAAAATPGLIGLGGGAVSLLGSAGAGALGAGALGLGGLGALGAGGGLGYAAARPAVQAVGEIVKAQNAYTEAVKAFGRASSQAAADKRKLDIAMSTNPGAAPAARQVGQLQSAYRSAFAPARQQIYQGIGGSAFNLSRAMPGLGQAAVPVAGALGQAATSFTGFLSQPAQLASVRQLAQGFARDLPIAERSLENISRIFLNLSVAAQPFFTSALQWVQGWTSGMAAQTGNTAKVQTTMSHLVDSAKDWVRLTGAAGRLLRDIFSAGRPQGDSMVQSLTRTLDRWDEWLQRNPQKVTNFFNQARTTTDQIATTFAGLASAIFRIGAALMPIFDRAAQLVGIITKLGPIGTTLLAGGFIGARGARGGGGSGLGGLVTSFLVGHPTPGLLGGGGGGAVPVAGAGGVRGAVGAAETRAGGYLLPRAGFQAGGGAAGIGTQERLFAELAGGGIITRGAGALPIAARGEQAFLQAYGGVQGARFALPELVASRAPSALARAGGAAADVGLGAARGAVRALPAAAAIDALIRFASGSGSISHRLGTTASGVLGDFIPGPLHSAATGASLTGQQGFLGRLSTQAGATRTPAQLRQVERETAHVQIQAEMSPADRKRFESQLKSAVNVAAQNAGVAASNSWQDAFTRAIGRGVKPKKAVATMVDGFDDEIRDLGPKGSKSWAKNTAEWIGEMQRDYPKMRKPLDVAAQALVDKLNDAHAKTGNKMKDIAATVYYYNGQILTGVDNTWGSIRDSMTDKAQVAQEKLNGTWGLIQQEAINALTQMGFSKGQAQTLVHQLSSGKKSQVNMANVSESQQQNTTTAAASAGKGVTPLGTVAPNQRGGMIGGPGLLDTVPVGAGGVAAPGETYIANRHTMMQLDLATLSKYGKTASQMIHDETRPHSAPMRRYQTGGLPPTNFDQRSWAGELLRELGDRPSTNAVGDVVAWETMEGGHWNNSASYNPLNTTQGPGSSINGVGVKAYGSWQEGFQRTIETLRNGAYSGILSALAKGVGLADFEATVNASPWGTVFSGKLGTPIAGGGGGAGAAPVIQQISSLKVPGNGLGGIPGLIGNAASRIMAQGLLNKINTNLAAAGGAGGGGAVPGGHGTVMDPSGKPVAGWIEPILNYARAHGWAGSVSSGYRSFAEQTRIYNSGVRPAAVPGTSNHEGAEYPRGAVDVTDASQLSSVLMGSPYASTLVWAGSKDPVHFSHPHGGSYATGGRVKWAGWHARGVNATTNGPTLFGAGEGGRRERVSVTPASSPTGGGGGGHQITVHMNIARLSSNPDEVERIGRQVATKLLDALDRAGAGPTDRQLVGGGS